MNYLFICLPILLPLSLIITFTPNNNPSWCYTLMGCPLTYYLFENFRLHPLFILFFYNISNTNMLIHSINQSCQGVCTLYWTCAICKRIMPHHNNDIKPSKLASSHHRLLPSQRLSFTTHKWKVLEFQKSQDSSIHTHKNLCPNT